jgi:hypothetical protein
MQKFLSSGRSGRPPSGGSSPLRLGLRGAAAALALAAGGCPGSGDPGVDETGEAPPPSSLKPPGPPAMEETVEEAADRIEELVSSGDCEQINTLNPPSRPKLATESRCQALRGLAGLPVKATASYGDVAGVIDYRRGERIVSALLVGADDGRFHIAFIDPFLGVASVGTERAPQLDLAAARAVRALRRHDCEAFLEVAYRRFGFAGGDDAEVCERVDVNPLAELTRGEEVRLERLGGNASYAFYGLRSPDTYLIVIAARQTETGLPEGMPPEVAELPEGAPEYGFLDALQPGAEPGA